MHDERTLALIFFTLFLAMMAGIIAYAIHCYIRDNKRIDKESFESELKSDLGVIKSELDSLQAFRYRAYLTSDDHLAIAVASATLDRYTGMKPPRTKRGQEEAIAYLESIQEVLFQISNDVFIEYLKGQPESEPEDIKPKQKPPHPLLQDLLYDFKRSDVNTGAPPELVLKALTVQAAAKLGMSKNRSHPEVGKLVNEALAALKSA